MAKKITGKPASLLDFMRKKRLATYRAKCIVCQLPAEVLAELADAKVRKVPLDIQLEWLQAEHGITLKRYDLESHRNGRHDER